MQSELSQAIKQLVQERGIPEDLVMSTIENFLLAAYKKKYGVVDNAVVRFSDDAMEVTLFAKKKIVLDDDLDDPVYEMPLSEALELNEECEVGDELLIEINPKEFDRVSVQSAKQKARQSLREIQKDTLYSEYKDKVGEMIIGYYQRERNGNIYVDLGKTEGILPKKYQSPARDLPPQRPDQGPHLRGGEDPDGAADRSLAQPRGVREEDLRARGSRDLRQDHRDLQDRPRAGLPHQDRRALDPRGRGPGRRVRRPQGRAHPGGGAGAGGREDRHPALLPGLAQLHQERPLARRGEPGRHPRRVQEARPGHRARRLVLPGHRQAGAQRAPGQPADGLEHRREDGEPVRRDGHLRRGQARRLRALRRAGGGDPEDLRAARASPRGWWRSWRATTSPTSRASSP